MLTRPSRVGLCLDQVESHVTQAQIHGTQTKSDNPGESANLHSNATQQTIKGIFFFPSSSLIPTWGFCLGKGLAFFKIQISLIEGSILIQVTVFERSSQLKIKITTHPKKGFWIQDVIFVLDFNVSIYSICSVFFFYFLKVFRFFFWDLGGDSVQLGWVACNLALTRPNLKGTELGPTVQVRLFNHWYKGLLTSHRREKNYSQIIVYVLLS